MNQLSGRFATFHNDKADSRTVPSTMVFASDLPPGYDPGVFYFAEFGIAVRLSGEGAVNFSGLYLHGSRPPCPLSGVQPISWATRFIAIHYSHDISISGNSILHWVPIRTSSTDEDVKKIEPFAMRPEMQTMK